MTRRVHAFSRRDAFRSSVIVTSLAALLCLAAPANAQIWRSGVSLSAFEPGLTMRGTDVAYDANSDVYLLVVGHGPIFGVFVNGSGVPIAPGFTIMDGSLGWGSFPRVEYGANVPNGVGGVGAFLVTWHHNSGTLNYVFARVVSWALPSRLVTGIQQISDGAQGGTWYETGPAIAYSKTSQRFLVAWRTLGYGIQGRFVTTYGEPVGPVMAFENPGASRDPAVAWNAATDEFGLVYTGFDGGAHASFRRVRAVDGAVSPRVLFGYSGGTYATAIDVNGWNHQYVVTWALHPGTVSAVFDSAGNLLTSNLVTMRLGFDQSLGMSYNPLSGTYLAVSSDIATFEVGGVELTTSGVPIGVAQVITDGARSGSFYPLTSVRPVAGQWAVVYARDFRGATSQMIGTATRGGGGGPAPAPSPSPSPTPQPAGCSTPDPFVAIGGGVCVNGGWVPRGTSVPAPAPSPAPAPAPSPSTCRTPDPFVSLGGGICVNGGWVPRGSTATPTPTPAPAPPPPSCTTPDPFTSIGGGTCVNGGWIPAVSSCTTPNPFASLGVGRCVNGGWVPW
jgi:hypothetical protein